MRYFVPAVDYPSGRRLVDPFDGGEFADRLITGLSRDSTRFRRSAAAIVRGTSFRGEIERRPEDRGDPRKVGWTFVVAHDDPRRAEIVEALEPLARHRGMADPRAPLVFEPRDEAEWADWLEETFSTLDGKARPLYFLLAGDPTRLPFSLQAFLDVAAAVGRLDFDDVEDYRRYAEKVIRLERAETPATTREAILFATDAGVDDPTYYSRRYMAAPLSKHMQDRLAFRVNEIFGEQATRDNLMSALRGAHPAVVYTASHGCAAFSKPDEVQREVNGAIHCQPGSNGARGDKALFAARDVPFDEPFLEGAIFFQFACLGYGTPAESHFAHWFPEVRAEHTTADFVAALPKRLIAHPRGPVGYIGHLDLAFLEGFTDADAPDIVEPWHHRLDPFADALDKLLQVQPAGLALERMNSLAAHLSNAIVNGHDRIKRRPTADTPAFRKNLASTFVRLGDARNYMLFGDPAARVRIADA
jgi:hypothetical protein